MKHFFKKQLFYINKLYFFSFNNFYCSRLELPNQVDILISLFKFYELINNRQNEQT